MQWNLSKITTSQDGLSLKMITLDTVEPLLNNHLSGWSLIKNEYYSGTSLKQPPLRMVSH